MSLRLSTPSRLHLGLLGWGTGNSRQFGGVGLMIDAPRLVIEAEPSAAWSADGPLADRTLDFARVAARALDAAGTPPPELAFRILQPTPEHVGLGTGTQLGLAVATLAAAAAGEPAPDAGRLASLTGRGLRSGIGLHGFLRGGLVVDGGRSPASRIPPLITRLAFPEDWHILLLIPRARPGVHGPDELRAFADLPPMPQASTDRLCRHVLLDLLPAVIEHDLAAFGQAVSSIQRLVGQAFAPVQGGDYLRAELEPLAALLEQQELVGIGQSSWGPGLFAFSDAPPEARADILSSIRSRADLDLDTLLWTKAANSGHQLTPPTP